jgi:hypothetical protein
MLCGHTSEAEDSSPRRSFREARKRPRAVMGTMTQMMCRGRLGHFPPLLPCVPRKPVMWQLARNGYLNDLGNFQLN